MNELQHDGLVCDFCSEPEPEWVLPVRSFQVVRAFNAKTGKTVTEGSLGDWATCGTCLRLVELRNVRLLVRRVASVRLERLENPTASDRFAHAMLVDALPRVYELVFDNIVGSPRRIADRERRLAEKEAQASRRTIAEATEWLNDPSEEDSFDQAVQNIVKGETS